MSIIKQITDEIETVDGVILLDVDPGKATNRTVVTFVGEPKPVIEAAFLAIKKASEIIDMRNHSGEHPRMGATDVCPLIPISNISMEEVVACVHELSKKITKDIDLPIFLYESAATNPERQNLANIRSGEYEGLKEKLKKEEWIPDYGPSKFNAQSGATAIGARDFLVAYNVNLNTSSVRRANSVAFDIREKGRIKREGNPITGKIILDGSGEPVRSPGACKSVKAIGWYIEEYGLAQISMNLTDINITPLHIAFEECRKSANKRGLRVTGSELVGLVPKKVLLEAGEYFLKAQNRSLGIPDKEIIHIAVKSLGLDELSPFDPKKKVIEYLLEDPLQENLVGLDLTAFANKTGSESPAPGGGSISAYVGALGAALGTMVANLSSHKRGWDHRWEEFSNWAVKGKKYKNALLELVDLDTHAFNQIIDAVRLPKSTEEEKISRKNTIEKATKNAIEVPYSIMKSAYECFDLLLEMVESGNPNSITDACVGALCARTAIHGALLNVKINCKDLSDQAYAHDIIEKAEALLSDAIDRERNILEMTEKVINS